MSLFTILYVADVCGKAGRQACAHMIKPLREKYKVDYVVANVENSAGGFGITPEMSIKAFTYGIDLQTSGNHIWDRVAILEYFERKPKLLRPANYPYGCPGRGSHVDTVNDVKVGVINLQGRTYMKEIDCPFQVGRREVDFVSKQTNVIIVDFHAEATSEKQAMGFYLNGKVSAVIGSHTHVQTVDDRITLRGTAYITDAGMTGPHDSIIGMETGPALGRFLTGMPKRFTTASDDVKLSGALVRIDPETGRAEEFERLRIDFDLEKFTPEQLLQDP
jgi:metallophosphoesterase (TIGR00282 family)